MDTRPDFLQQDDSLFADALDAAVRDFDLAAFLKAEAKTLLEEHCRDALTRHFETGDGLRQIYAALERVLGQKGKSR